MSGSADKRAGSLDCRQMVMSLVIVFSDMANLTAEMRNLKQPGTFLSSAVGVDVGADDSFST